MCTIVRTVYMCAELRESTGGRKSIHVTVHFEPRVYSRLVLLAHRNERTLGEEIRQAAQAHIDRQQDESESA